jgi:hypothetical protein
MEPNIRNANALTYPQSNPDSKMIHLPSYRIEGPTPKPFDLWRVDPLGKNEANDVNREECAGKYMMCWILFFCWRGVLNWSF